MQTAYPLTCAALSLLILASCATTTPRPTITPEEQARVDQGLGVQLARDLESQLTLRKDAEVNVYLRKLAAKLAEARPEIRDAPLGVLLVSAIQGEEPRWRTFSLPGNRIYLPVGLLKSVEYESELAAAVAFELAHVANRHVMDNLAALEAESDTDVTREGAAHVSKLRRTSQEVDAPIFSPQLPPSVEYFGPRGIFFFSEAEFESSAETAVELLYRAGFDPRGLTALWKRFERNPERSPYDARVLSRLLDRTREAIALHTPLRNPIVRSEAFLLAQKRFQLL